MLTLSTHVSGFTLHTVIWFTLSKHMLGSKFSDFHERSFFHAYTLHTCFRIHSPYSCLVYTLQAHVRFKIFRFLREIIFSCLHSPHMFQGSLSIQLFGLHSPSTCWFKIFKFSQKFFFHAYTLHTCFRIHSPYSYLVYTLQAHVRFKIFKFSQIIFLCFHSPHMFQGSLSIQLFSLHSPSTCYVQHFWIFTGFHLFHTYTLHSCFRVHSPCRCYISKFYIVFIISSCA